MKRVISILIIVVLIFSLVACGNSNNSGSEDKGNNDKAALDYPKRAIEIIVPFGAGGSADMMTRQLANMMGDYVDKPVNVINKAMVELTNNYVAQAPADGYTVLQITPSHAIAEALERPNADLTGGFEPIANFQKDIQLFGVAKDSPFKQLMKY